MFHLFPYLIVASRGMALHVGVVPVVLLCILVNLDSAYFTIWKHGLKEVKL